MTSSTLKDAKEFLDLIKTELNLKSASLVADKTGFFIWIKNDSCSCKQVILGEADLTQDPYQTIKEIKELIESQKW